MHSLDQTHADTLARLALKGLQREYPNHLMHLLNGEEDVRRPRELHPAFYGCYDWHSSVHSHWLLVRLLRAWPAIEQASVARRMLGENLRAEHIQAEAGYFKAPNRQTFERPYGWGWLLKLTAELHGWDDPDARVFRANLEPLTCVIVERYLSFLPKQRYPIRVGTHFNTAFSLLLAWDYAEASLDTRLRACLEEAALRYYREDADAPAHIEPSGDDFLSGTLTEAALMARILAPAAFDAWFARFLPDFERLPGLFCPAVVEDRSDPKLVHLDGLNLSRAFCMRRLAAALPEGARRGALVAAAEHHAEAGLAGLESGEYAGEHWLGTFALLMLSERRP